MQTLNYLCSDNSNSIKLKNDFHKTFKAQTKLSLNMEKKKKNTLNFMVHMNTQLSFIHYFS